MSEAIKQAGDALTAVAAYPEIRQYIGTVLHDQIREALAALSAEQPKPVAWITYKSKDGKRTLELGCTASNIEYIQAHKEWEWTPLYASPIAAPASQPEQTQLEQWLDADNLRLRRTIQKMMARLADLLDEDHFAEIDHLVSAAGVAAPSKQGFEPMDEWVAYAKRSGLLDANGVATDPHKTQTAWNAFTAAWNRSAVAPKASQPDAAAIRNKALEEAALLDFIQSKGYELSSDHDEDDPWVVHRVSGSPNDREWHEIGRGETVRAAIKAAMEKEAQNERNN